MKLKHIDLNASSVNQDAREVKTKFSKSFTTFFFPVGDEIRAIVADWVVYLREIKLWGNDDPLFPATRVDLGTTRQFEASGFQRAHWSSASPIRVIFREAFAKAGLPYFNPHSFRNTLVQLGQGICKSPEEFKAWSQNLGHESPLTTLINYGKSRASARERSSETLQRHNRQCSLTPTKLRRQCAGDCAILVCKCRLNERNGQPDRRLPRNLLELERIDPHSAIVASDSPHWLMPPDPKHQPGQN